MTALQVTLKRSPRSLIVGDHTITIESPRDGANVEPPADRETVASEKTSGGSPANSEASEPNARKNDQESPTRHSTTPMPTSVGCVTTDTSKKIVTPLALSNAVPILAGATHEVVTAEQVGLGGVSDEELADLRQILANTADLVMELQEQHRRSLSEMQEVAVELATAAASWLVGFAIERGHFAVDDLIQHALHQMDADQPVRVRMNPADHDLLQNLIRDPEGRELVKNVSCFDDPTMARGSVRVESGRRILLTDMNSRLEDIRRSWMEKLDDSQVERRGDGSAAGRLRRFPERRETA